MIRRACFYMLLVLCFALLSSIEARESRSWPVPDFPSNIGPREAYVIFSLSECDFLLRISIANPFFAV